MITFVYKSFATLSIILGALFYQSPVNASINLTEKNNYMIEPGQIAPDFSLPDENGKTFRLSDNLGKIVILYFYPHGNYFIG